MNRQRELQGRQQRDWEFAERERQSKAEAAERERQSKARAAEQERRWAAWNELSLEEKRSMVLAALYQLPIFVPGARAVSKDNVRGNYVQTLTNEKAVDRLLDKHATNYNGHPDEPGASHFSWIETVTNDPAYDNIHWRELSDVVDSNSHIVRRLHRSSKDECIERVEVVKF
jgi:hypothetical protein